ncbi:hypothetical protein GJAV_G00122060 [Gymnothorax javanicus]|nr:hypothetical protein GJAV_G00122060 [Gymnothorax javanicus]
MEERGKLSACSAADASAEEEIWCLERVGKTSDWLRLFDDAEVTLGRALNVTYQLLSASYPLMISRQHCVLKQNEDGQWTVTDKKSLNGVWVNGERIAAERAWPLSAGDSVRLGVPVEGTQVEFEYVLIRDVLKAVSPFLLPPRPGTEATASSTTPRAKKAKRKLEGADSDSSESRAKLYCRSGGDCVQSRSPCPPPPPQAQTPPHMRPCEGPGPSVLPHSKLSPTHEQRHGDGNRLGHTQQQPASQGDPLQCKQAGRSVQKEEELKKRLEEALQEQRKVMEELKCSRQGFEEILQAKDKELEMTKEEKEQARAQKDEVVIQMTDVLENELQCIICSELFIEAVTLSCAHSFCLHCIEAWRKRSGACPICRQDIQSQSRSLVLDNCIDRMVESLSSELKERRQALITERKAQSTEKAVKAVVVISDDDASADSTFSSIDDSVMGMDDTFDESELFSDSQSLASPLDTSLSPCQGLQCFSLHYLTAVNKVAAYFISPNGQMTNQLLHHGEDT